MTEWRRYLGATSNGSRGVFGGGSDSNNPVNIIHYITIATTGNATDFGDLTVARQGTAACADSTRGVWMGGNGSNDTIQYVTVASVGNASDFGDLTVARDRLGQGASDSHGGLGD